MFFLVLIVTIFVTALLLYMTLPESYLLGFLEIELLSMELHLFACEKKRGSIYFTYEKRLMLLNKCTYNRLEDILYPPPSWLHWIPLMFTE